MLAVTIRELKARWILFPTAVVLAVLAAIAMRSVSFGYGDADKVVVGTWIGTLVVGVLIGLSLLGDELTTGKLSFYFTRPFSPTAIFTGKFVGGVIATLVAQAIVLAIVAVSLPPMDMEPARSAWEGSQLDHIPLRLVEVALATCGVVGIGMAAGIATRARTWWFVLDIGGLAAVGVMIAFVVARVSASTHETGARTVDAAVLQLAGLVVLVVGLAAATARALARGRTDAVRTHASLSATLWPIVVPASGGLLVAAMLWF